MKTRQTKTSLTVVHAFGRECIGLLVIARSSRCFAGQKAVLYAHRWRGPGHRSQEHFLSDVGPGLCPSFTVLAVCRVGQCSCVRVQPQLRLCSCIVACTIPAGIVHPLVHVDVAIHRCISHCFSKCCGSGFRDLVGTSCAAVTTADEGLSISNCTPPPPMLTSVHTEQPRIKQSSGRRSG